MDRQMDRVDIRLEQAAYLDFRGAKIYSVLHEAENPIARVLLVGPFASERYFAYVPWVQWARFLAARKIEVLRFDYRGVGESTGEFENMSFTEWNEDVEFLAGWLTRRLPHVPLILHGLELGAILASRTFAVGLGDALLLWSAPENANDVLRRPLSRHAFKNVYARKSVSECIRELETEQPLEVEGYQWTWGLWRESFAFKTTGVNEDVPSGSPDRARPMKVVRLDGSPASLLKGSSMGYIVSHNLDLSDLYADNFEWMIKALAVAQGSQQ